MFRKVVRNLGMLGVVTALVAAEPEEHPVTKLEGVLIDQMCSYKAETRVVPGPRLEGGIIAIYSHTKRCALMPECQKSGYGVFTYDQKFVPFDEAGNQKAMAYFKQSAKDDDFRVAVTGQMQGEVFKVSAIMPLP